MKNNTMLFILLVLLVTLLSVDTIMLVASNRANQNNDSLAKFVASPPDSEKLRPTIDSPVEINGSILVLNSSGSYTFHGWDSNNIVLLDTGGIDLGVFGSYSSPASLLLPGRVILGLDAKGYYLAK